MGGHERVARHVQLRRRQGGEVTVEELTMTYGCVTLGGKGLEGGGYTCVLVKIVGKHSARSVGESHGMANHGQPTAVSRRPGFVHADALSVWWCGESMRGRANKCKVNQRHTHPASSTYLTGSPRRLTSSMAIQQNSVYVKYCAV
jgi:hypothetical protein